MRKISTALFVIVALINLAPGVGVLSAERLHSLYGLAVDEPNLLILLRHRAVLLGIVGALVMAAAFRTRLRPVAYLAGFTSMASFILVIGLVGDAGAQLRQVAAIDLFACGLFALAACVDFWRPETAEPS